MSASGKCSACPLLEELIQEVLIRLPIKSLLRFRCIFKGICNLIDSPEFKKCYDTYHNSVSDFSVMLLEARRLFLLDFNLLGNLNSSEEKEISIPLDESVEFIGCCKGIVCLETSLAPKRYVLLNPSNGTFQILEQSSNLPPYRFESVGFGYDSVTDDYKLVRWVHLVDSNIQYLDVYSMRRDSWRQVTREFNPGFSDGYFCHSRVVCVEGVLHWIWANFHRHNCIAAFDLETEELRLVKEPPKVGEPICLSTPDFGGRLYIISEPIDGSAILWVMTEYGVESSWTPLFNIVNEPHSLIGYFPTRDSTRLLCFESDPISDSISDSILWYWLNTQDDGSMEDIQIRKLPRYGVPSAQLFPQSWVCVRSPVRLGSSQVQND